MVVLYCYLCGWLFDYDYDMYIVGYLYLFVCGVWFGWCSGGELVGVYVWWFVCGLVDVFDWMMEGGCV